MAEYPATIDGHQIELSEGRRVFAGDYDESWYIQFTSKEGELRKLRISHEAADALVQLLTAPQTVMRFKLMVGADEMKWEAFEPDLVNALLPQEGAQNG